MDTFCLVRRISYEALELGDIVLGGSGNHWRITCESNYMVTACTPEGLALSNDEYDFPKATWTKGKYKKVGHYYGTD